MKSPVEHEEVTIFKNVELPTNYYTMDNKADFTSTTKVSQICNDLKQAIGGVGYRHCGLVYFKNGMYFVGFYEVVDNRYISITLGFYGPTIYLIGLSDDTPYTRTITSTAPS